MGAFIVSSLINLIAVNGGVPTGYTIQGLTRSFDAAKAAYNAEDLRRDKAKFARDKARIQAKVSAEYQNYLYNKAISDSNYRSMDSNLRRIERDILGK